LSDFLCDALLAGRQEDGKKEQGDAVRVITGHSAKGLEYPFVFLPGLEEEIFPHKNAIEGETVEEERRLFYVAMTRARRELTLSWNRRRVLRGREVERRPSRFLEEIPEEFLEKADTPTRETERQEWLSQLRAKLKTGNG
jgi:ATP-dependent DNA helicase Rep